MPSLVELEGLLAEPRETMEIEVKEWLDLQENDHRALLAKEIIALANHGGGYIVVGFRETDDGLFEPVPPSPEQMRGWSQDAVQDVVSKYVDGA